MNEWINKKNVAQHINSNNNWERKSASSIGTNNNRNVESTIYKNGMFFRVEKKLAFKEDKNHFYWQFISCCRKQDWFFYWLHIFRNTTITTIHQHNRYSNCCVFWFFKVVNVWKVYVCVHCIPLGATNTNDKHSSNNNSTEEVNQMNCALAHCSDALTQIYIRHT